MAKKSRPKKDKASIAERVRRKATTPRRTSPTLRKADRLKRGAVRTARPGQSVRGKAKAGARVAPEDRILPMGQDELEDALQAALVHEALQRSALAAV